MTATTTPTGPTPPRRRVEPSNPAYRPERAVFLTVTRQTLRIGVGLWPIVLVVMLGVPMIVDHVGGQVGSIYSGVAQGPRWFMFVMGIVVVAEGLGPHIAHGLTRRTFVAQNTAGFAVVGAVFGAVSMGLALVERWFYDRLDWPAGTFYGEHPVPITPWLLVLVDHGVLLIVYALSGFAVGAVYYRWGGWIGTLTLPLTVGPVLVAAVALPHVDSTDLAWIGWPDQLPYVAGLTIAVVVAAALWAVARLVLGGARLRSRPGAPS